MVRSRTRKLRPKVPVFPFASGISNTLMAAAVASTPGDVDDEDNYSEDEKETKGTLPDSPTVQSDNASPSSSSGAADVTVSGASAAPPSVPQAAPGAVPEVPQAASGAAPSDGGVPPVAVTKKEKMNHHDSICFLKIIGSIQSGQKLSHMSNNPNQPFSIDPNQWSSSFSRWWNGDSRSMTVKILRDRFNQVFKNIDEAYNKHTQKGGRTKSDAFNRSPKDILLDYARELSGAEKGLRHLSHTYKKDIPITSELQVMLESVQIRKQTIDNMFTIKDD